MPTPAEATVTPSTQATQELAASRADTALAEVTALPGLLSAELSFCHTSTALFWSQGMCALLHHVRQCGLQ